MIFPRAPSMVSCLPAMAHNWNKSSIFYVGGDVPGGVVNGAGRAADGVEAGGDVPGGVIDGAGRVVDSAGRGVDVSCRLVDRLRYVIDVTGSGGNRVELALQRLGALQDRCGKLIRPVQ